MPVPHSSILRRQAIPRVPATSPFTSHKALPDFLRHCGSARKTRINGLNGPTPKTRMACFDAREDVLSVVIDPGQRPPDLHLQTVPNGVQLMANGKPLAHISDMPAGLSLTDVVVIEASPQSDLTRRAAPPIG